MKAKTLKSLAFAILLFLSLFWVYPNLVHESAHYVALQVQGIGATINYDWGFPAHPSITPESELKSFIGAILYYTAPSLLAITALLGMWAFLRPSIVTIVLGTYLSTDVLLNILKYKNPTSDFFWLPYTGAAVWIVVAATLLFVMNALICASFIQTHLNRGNSNSRA